MRQHAGQEWSYGEGSEGIVFCVGLSRNESEQEMVASYYRTNPEHATKSDLEGENFYRRFIYQGLPEERQKLEEIERPEVVRALLSATEQGATDIVGSASDLEYSDEKYASPSYWMDLKSERSSNFQRALDTSIGVLSVAGVEIAKTRMYGAASFGLLSASDKLIDDIDIVIAQDRLEEFREAMTLLRTGFEWSEIDPHQRLPERRQIQKAKRWSTSQIRLTAPYPMSIDLKVARTSGSISLWDGLNTTPMIEQHRFDGSLRVIDDDEGYSTSPALTCEDQEGNPRSLLLRGYQYIGTAVAGDVVHVAGVTNLDDPTAPILVTQSENDSLIPDMTSVDVR